MGSAYPIEAHFNKGLFEKSSLGSWPILNLRRYPLDGIDGRLGGQYSLPETAPMGRGLDVIDGRRCIQRA